MTMGFCHANQVQNISTAGQVLSCLISVKRAFATKRLQLNYCLPLRIEISYTYVLCASISLFILTLNLEYGNKGDDDYKGYPAVQGKERRKRRENAGVMPLLCSINATPCAPVSGSKSLVRLWRLWTKTDFAPSGGDRAGNMWQLICANKHLWRSGEREKKTPAGALQPCHLHRPPQCLWLSESWEHNYHSDTVLENWKS